VTQRASRRQLAFRLSGPEAGLDLGEAALLIAAEEYPDLDVADQLRRLDALAADLRRRAGSDPGAEVLVAALTDLLFGEEGFRGNETHYYDPRNSYLNEVLDRRLGIPITLSLLAMEVARRAGYDEVRGVGLPGHFLARAGSLLFDPFHGGAVLSLSELEQRLARVAGRPVPLRPELLEPAGKRAILARLLRNLRAIHLRQGDYLRCLAVLDLLRLVEPGSGEHLRERGLLHAAFGGYALAAGDLEAYLTEFGERAEDGPLRETIARMRFQASRLN
jgi:regulator of sirC expression with transglutaminase-like and TPR domain